MTWLASAARTHPAMSPDHGSMLPAISPDHGSMLPAISPGHGSMLPAISRTFARLAGPG